VNTFIQDIDDINNESEVKTRSSLAVASLVCSLIVCCPIVSVFGPILGFIALVRMKSKPHLSGKGFAWSGIVIGLLATILSTLVIVFVTQMAYGFIEKSSEVTAALINDGYNDDYDAVRNSLSRTSSTVTDSEIHSFIENLRSRYGNFDSIAFNWDEQDQPKSTGTEAVLPMRFIFETTDVIAIVAIEVVPKGGFDFDIKVHCLKIEDAINGDLVFPTDSMCASQKIESSGDDAAN